MSTHWKELLPVDQYIVTHPEPIDMYHLNLLASLYQPLIGPLACQLYTTFLFESEEKGEIRSHYHLMLGTASSLEDLFTERKKLEAIGLLSVYKKTAEESAVLIYELKPPLSPTTFFSDGLLNIYLYNRVGKNEYLRLKKRFVEAPLTDWDGFEEVTAAFNDVFTSLRPSEMKHVNGEMEDFPSHNEKHEPSPRLDVGFDFSQLFLLLSDVIISEKAFTEPVKEAIRQLSFVYHIQPSGMAHIIQQAFIHSGEIDIPTLRKAVRHYYQLENGDQLPSLSLRSQDKNLRETHEDVPPETDYESQIRLFETLSPYDLLRNMAGGSEPVQSDLRIVEGLLFDQKLPPGVVNVLLDYTMLVNDKKLIKSYIEKIASHWARKKVQTVREAMSLAKSEHKKYQNWKTPANGSKSSSQTRRPLNPRQDRLPKWMKNDKTKQQENPAESSKTKEDPNLHEREKWLEEYLHNL